MDDTPEAKQTDRLIDFLVEFIQKVFHRDVLVIALPIYFLCIFILYQAWWKGSYEYILEMELQGDSKDFFTLIYLPIYAILLLLVRLEIRATNEKNEKGKRNIFKESKREINIIKNNFCSYIRSVFRPRGNTKTNNRPIGNNNVEDQPKNTIPGKVKQASRTMKITNTKGQSEKSLVDNNSLLKIIKGRFIFHIAIYLISLITFYALIDKLFYTLANLSNSASCPMIIFLGVVVVLIFFFVPYYMIHSFIILILIGSVILFCTFKTKNIENMVFKAKAGFEIEDINFKDVTFDNIEEGKFINCKMEYCNFKGVLDNVTFDNCNIEIDSANTSILKFTTFKNCGLTFRNYVEGKMEDVEFTETVLYGSLLEQVNFKRVNFRDSTVRSTKFKNCNWEEVRFEDGILGTVDIIYDIKKDIIFQGVKFKGATLINSELANKDTSRYLELGKDVEFDNTVLKNVHFNNVNLAQTNVTFKQLYSPPDSSFFTHVLFPERVKEQILDSINQSIDSLRYYRFIVQNYQYYKNDSDYKKRISKFSGFRTYFEEFLCKNRFGNYVEYLQNLESKENKPIQKHIKNCPPNQYIYYNKVPHPRKLWLE